jgi:hypothetical protein
MPSYLVETFLPRGATGDRTARERRARSAAEELTRQGTRVRFDHTLDPFRVVEAISSGKE